MIRSELIEETFILPFMKLESSLRESRNADNLEKQYGLSWNGPAFYLLKLLRYDSYFKSFLRTIKLLTSGTVDVYTS